MPVRRQHHRTEADLRDQPAQRAAGGVLGAAAAGLASLDSTSLFQRLAHAAPAALPDIQFAIGRYLGPAVRKSEAGAPKGGTMFGFGPTYTLFLTARLNRTPSQADRLTLEKALSTIEQRYAFRASGVFTYISYGLPYFSRLPAGPERPRWSAAHLPRLLGDPPARCWRRRCPAPTDVHPDNPGITKRRFTVPVRIEAERPTVHLPQRPGDDPPGRAGLVRGSGAGRASRSPSPAFAGLLNRHLAAGTCSPGRACPGRSRTKQLPYASYIHPESPMWMGFADMVADASGPPEICTFQGNPSARLTTEKGTGYFDNSSIQVLNHVILDLMDWYITTSRRSRRRTST